MTRYIVAVSGGVDSVALLDAMNRLPGHELIVAHFDHGIRDDSHEDAAFVRDLATQTYHLPFETAREDLGATASEDLARRRRYAFLRNLAEKHNATIVTAHHSDDLVETVAINHIRGTGWRGLAVLDSDISRPFLHTSKHELLDYAQRHGLRWREDSTNASDKYLRNRVRRATKSIPTDTKQQIHSLREQQIALKKEIEKEVVQLVGEGPDYSRYFFTHIPAVAALECLRYVTKGKLTRPQLERALLAIKTHNKGKIYQAGSHVQLHFTTRTFTVQLIK